MTSEHQNLFEAALKLPESMRASLAEKLLKSLSPDVDELTDDEFFSELERCRTEVERDPSAAIP